MENTNTNTVWQVVDLEADKVFFTTRDSQAERWNNDEQFEVTPSPSRRPVDGYTMWCLNSDVDKHSLKLGMEVFVEVMGELLEYATADRNAEVDEPIDTIRPEMINRTDLEDVPYFFANCFECRKGTEPNSEWIIAASRAMDDGWRVVNGDVYCKDCVSLVMQRIQEEKENA